MLLRRDAELGRLVFVLHKIVMTAGVDLEPVTPSVCQINVWAFSQSFGNHDLNLGVWKSRPKKNLIYRLKVLAQLCEEIVSRHQTIILFQNPKNNKREFIVLLHLCSPESRTCYHVTPNNLATILAVSTGLLMPCPTMVETAVCKTVPGAS